MVRAGYDSSATIPELLRLRADKAPRGEVNPKPQRPNPSPLRGTFVA